MSENYGLRIAPDMPPLQSWAQVTIERPEGTVLWTGTLDELCETVLMHYNRHLLIAFVEAIQQNCVAEFCEFHAISYRDMSVIADAVLDRCKTQQPIAVKPPESQRERAEPSKSDCNILPLSCWKEEDGGDGYYYRLTSDGTERQLTLAGDTGWEKVSRPLAPKLRQWILRRLAWYYEFDLSEPVEVEVDAKGRDRLCLELGDARTEVKKLTAELEQARAEIARLKCVPFGTARCLQCGEVLPADRVHMNHWRTCEKHPARLEVEKLNAEINRLKVEHGDLAEARRLAAEWLYWKNGSIVVGVNNGLWGLFNEQHKMPERGPCTAESLPALIAFMRDNLNPVPTLKPSDDECWEWFKKQGSDARMAWDQHKQQWWCDPNDMVCMAVSGYGSTPIAAIRAAKKAWEERSKS